MVLVILYCISKTDPETHRVYLRQEALDIMKNEIQNNPQGYFGMFIRKGETSNPEFIPQYLQLIIPQYFISNKSGIWSLSLIVHSKG